MIVLSDNDVRGAVSVLCLICESEDWVTLSREIDVQFRELEDMNLADNSTDREIWRFCQENNILLITGDRSENDGEHSLGQIIRRFGGSNSLPVVTIGDPKRIVNDRDYAESCAARLLDYLLDIDGLRGTGRLYLSSL